MPQQSPSRRPTLEDVAARAGVGRGTASRALTGTGSVAPATVDKVLAAATSLGYRYNAAARSLVTHRTGTVALVIAEPGDRLFTEPFFAALSNGVGARLAAEGVLMVLVSAWPGTRPTLLGRGHVDGVLLASAHSNHPLMDAARNLDVPLVSIGRPPEQLDAPWVDVDNAGGASEATHHLIDQGCRRLATIAGPDDMEVGLRRLQGWREALTARGLTGLEESGDFSLPAGRAAMERLLAVDPLVDGVFAASDSMAAGACQALRAAGRRVGTDVRVVGFDDSMLAQGAEPSLSSVAQPVGELGSRAAEVLLDLIAGRSTTTEVLLPTRLVERASSGSPVRLR